MSLYVGFHCGPCQSVCQRPSGVRGGLMDLHIRVVQLGLQKPFKDKHIKVSVGRRVQKNAALGWDAEWKEEFEGLQKAGDVKE